ncbi:hypothetical protein, partial [Alcanivorax sp. UBA3183]|uniref:hypothetical protein n=1 Tax=Alcanivorax sp. UBA3183 TaxID=1945980 RepID=UPI00257D381E
GYTLALATWPRQNTREWQREMKRVHFIGGRSSAFGSIPWARMLQALNCSLDKNTLKAPIRCDLPSEGRMEYLGRAVEMFESVSHGVQ